MGLVNINGSNVHTSNIYTGTGTISSITSNSTGSLFGYSVQSQKITYHILGEDLEVDGWVDSNVAMMIAIINVLGKPYYDELKKQHIYLPKEIENFLENKFIVLERDRKIDEVINIKST